MKKQKTVEDKNAFQEVNESRIKGTKEKPVSDKKVQQANDALNVDDDTADRG